jgi:hypothetical protein
MNLKCLKYWKEIPFLYVFAFILDPRAKIRALAYVMSMLRVCLFCAHTSPAKYLERDGLLIFDQGIPSLNLSNYLARICE